MPSKNRPSPHTNRARVIGKPGTSSDRQYRQAVAAYRRVPGKWILIVDALTIAIVTAGAFALHKDPLTAGLITASILAGIEFVARYAQVAATVAVVTLAIAFTLPVSTFFAAAANSGAVDMNGATLTWVVSIALVGVLAHRTSRGRPWLTTLLAALAAVPGGLLLLSVQPAAGFAAAWAVMAAVLWLRGGGGAWLKDQAAELRDVIARRRTPTTGLPVRMYDLSEKYAAETATGTLLATLPEGYTVMHDRRLSDGTPIDHLVVGPTGTYALTSHTIKGRISDDPTVGLTHPKIPVAPLLYAVATAADALTRRTRLTGVTVSPLLVVHRAVLPTPRSRVRLSNATGGLGEVALLAPAVLLDTLTDGPTEHTPRQVKRIVARLDRICPPRTRPVTTRHSDGPVNMTVLDDNHQPRITPAAVTPTALFMSDTSATVLRPDQPVSLLTDQGAFTGYRVHGEPTLNPDGLMCIPVLDETTADGEVVWFPLDSVQPLNRLG